MQIKRIGLRVHSCADTLAAVTAFASDLASSFERVTEELYATFSKIRRNHINLRT